MGSVATRVHRRFLVDLRAGVKPQVTPEKTPEMLQDKLLSLPTESMPHNV